MNNLEKELRLLTQRQEALIFAIPEIIMEVDNNKIYRWANKQGLEFFGDDVIGKEVADYFEGIQETINIVQPIFTGLENIIYVESWQRRKDGEKRLLGWYCSTLRNENGEIIGALSSARDITEQKLAEEKLKETNALLRIAEEKAHIGGWNVLLEENRSYWSDEVALIHEMPPGYAPLVEEGINFYAPEWRDRITKVFTDCAQKGIPYDEEMQIITSTGKQVWVRTIGEAVRNEKGEIYKVQGAFQDITKQKKAEKEIRLSEEKFRNFFENSVVGKSITKIGGEIEVNKAFCKILGYSKEELSKSKWQELTHPDDIKRDQIIINSILTGEKDSMRWEKRYIHKDGHIVWVDLSTFLQRNSEGKPEYFITTILDINERKESEIVLRESEEKFKAMVETIPLAIHLTTGIEQITVYINPMMVKLFGYDIEDLPSVKEWWSLAYPDENYRKQIAEEWNSKVKKAIETHSTIEGMETKVTCKDGSVKYVSWGYITLGDNNYSYGLNLTERKKAEEALIQTERAKTEILEKLNDVQHMALIGGWEWNLETNQVWWSDETYKIFGVTPETFNPGFEENGQFIHPDDLDKYNKTFELSLRTGEPLDCEYRLVTRDGQLKYSQAKGKIIYNDSGKQISFIGTIMDVTEQKKSEAALRESEERYRSLLNHLEAGVVVHNPDTSIIMNNHRASVLLGLSDDQMKGKLAIDPHWKFINLDKSPLLLDEYPVNRIRNSKKSINNQTMGVVHNSDNDIVWLLVNGFPVFDDNGEISEILVSFIDITERIQGEQEILLLNTELEHRVIQRTEQLEMANKELEAFTYSVSHDLRAPLRHINGYVDLLLRRYHEKLPEKGQHYLDTIADSANQMGILIDELLEFSRTGRQELHHIELDMNKVVEEALNQIKLANQKRNIDWKISHLPCVIGDHSMMRLVWTNLLSNAVKFTRPREKAVIEIASYIENDEFVFFVRDNGVGFDMQYSNKLFGVFQRLHPVEDFEGTGIGLANVRRIIIKHGGRNWAESTLNEGATFYFTIPTKQE